MCGPDCPPPIADAPKAYHQAEIRGSDSLGYGQCTGCGEMWPCMAYRGERQ
jgi:hypothetical protein